MCSSSQAATVGGVQQWFAASHAVHSHAGVAHAVDQRTAGGEVRQRQVVGGKFAEQGGGTDIGAAKPGAFLAAQGIEFDGAGGDEAFGAQAAQGEEAGDHARGTVVVTALRDGIEVGAAGKEGQGGIAAGEGDHQIRTGVAFAGHAPRAGFLLHDVEGADLPVP